MAMSAFHASVCLLKTAIAEVSSYTTIAEGHILFDEGAQRSFITQQLADELYLQPTSHETISVSSFGAQVSPFETLAVATMFVHALDGTCLEISILIVPKLAVPIQNYVRTHLHTISYLKSLPLAHPANKLICTEAIEKRIYRCLHKPSYLTDTTAYGIESWLIVFCHEFVHPPRYSFCPRHASVFEKEGKFIKKCLSVNFFVTAT